MWGQGCHFTHTWKTLTWPHHFSKRRGLSPWNHLHDGIISQREEVWAHKTSFARDVILLEGMLLYPLIPNFKAKLFCWKVQPNLIISISDKSFPWIQWNNGNGLFVEVTNYVYFGLFGWIVWSTRLRHNEFKLPFNMLPILPCIYTSLVIIFLPPPLYIPCYLIIMLSFFFLSQILVHIINNSTPILIPMNILAGIQFDRKTKNCYDKDCNWYIVYCI